MDIPISNNGMNAIVSSMGGIVTEFSWHGKNIIYPQRPVGDKMRGGIPICFPFFSYPPDNFKEIPHHGWLRHQELDVFAAARDKVILRGKHTGTKVYPWSLKYEIVVRLTPESGLFLSLWTARSEDGLGGQAPINPGFHPYFMNLGERYAQIGQSQITNFPEKAERIFANRRVLIGLGELMVKMTFGEDFSLITLWSDSEDYFCVEPILNNPLDVNTSRGKYLKEGEVLRLACSLKIV